MFYVLGEANVAKPCLVYKTSNGVYYAELLLQMELTQTRKSQSKRCQNVFFNNLRNYDFSSDEVLKIVQTLQDRKLIQFFVIANTPQSRPIEEFWNYDSSKNILVSFAFW